MYDIKKYFGATGDGFSDDTNAFLDASNSRLSPIFVPPGRYGIKPGDWIHPRDTMGMTFIGANGNMRSTPNEEDWFCSIICPVDGATTDSTLIELPLLTDLGSATSWNKLCFQGLEHDDGTATKLKRLVLLRGTANRPNFNASWTECSFRHATHYGMHLDTRLADYSTVADFSMVHTWWEFITNDNFVHDSSDPEEQMADAFLCRNEQAISIHFYHWLGTFCDRCFNIEAGGNMAVFGGGVAICRVILKTGFKTEDGRDAGLSSNVKGFSINDWKCDAQGPRVRLLEDEVFSSDASNQGKVGGPVVFNRLQISGSQALGKNTDGKLRDTPITPFVPDRPMIQNYGGQMVILRDCVIPDDTCKASSDTANDGTLALLDSGSAGSGRGPALLIENVVDLLHEGGTPPSRMGGNFTFENRYLQFADNSSIGLKAQWSAVNVYSVAFQFQNHTAEAVETDEGVYSGGDVNVWTEAEKDNQIADVDAIKLVTDLIPNSGSMTSDGTVVAQASALTTVDGEVGQILVVTDAIPNNGAMTSVVAQDATVAKAGTTAGLVAQTNMQTDVTAVKLVTDAIPTPSVSWATLAQQNTVAGQVADLVDFEEGDRIIFVGAGGALELHKKDKTTKVLLQTAQKILKIDGTAETDPDQSPGQVVT